MDLTYKVIKSIVKKKKGFGANGGFDFTKKLKEIFRKKKARDNQPTIPAYHSILTMS